MKIASSNFNNRQDAVDKSKKILSKKTLNFTAAFSAVFRDQLKQFYRTDVPSCANIARDFSRRSPHLQSVSSETVRKWLIGASLPHPSRMRVLVDWLGDELEQVFNPAYLVQVSRQIKSNKLVQKKVTLMNDEDQLSANEVLQYFMKLNNRDKTIVICLLKTLTRYSYAGGVSLELKKRNIKTQ